MKVLFIGDVVGRPGRQAVKALLPRVAERYKASLVIANAENAAGGFGLTPQTAEELLGAGIHVLSSGNHIWDKKEALGLLQKDDRILRPLNYPPGVPGRGSILLSVQGRKVAVVNLSGRIFMPLLDCPFRTIKEELKDIKKETNLVVVDFHAEATSEKLAMAYFLDGQVSALVGTHTHVQTADEQILPGGTAYITDVGMTGPRDSIIGMAKEDVLRRFLYQMPQRFSVAKAPTMFSAVMLELDERSGKALSIQRLCLSHP